MAPADPTRAKFALLAAYERGRSHEGSTIFRALRIAVPAGAVAASLVLGFGVLRGPRVNEIRMTERGDLVARAESPRLPVVDRQLMPIVPSLGDGPDAP